MQWEQEMMRKNAMILIISICILFICPIGKSNVEVEAAAITYGNIKINANVVNVRQEKATNSKILCQVTENEVYKVLEEGKDSEGKLWYKVNGDFGVTGWVAGWLCRKTNEKPVANMESNKGDLLYECSNTELFIKLLLLKDYSIKDILKICGSNYTVKKYNYHTVYEYKNGIKINIENGEVSSVDVGGRVFYPELVQKKSCDILKDKGNEVLILDNTSLIIVNESTKKILREYSTGYSSIDGFEVGNFIGGSNPELYLFGSGSGFVKRNIYKVSNDKFVRIYDIASFDYYGKNIKANIDKNVLTLDIKIGKYIANVKSTLPERVFYNTKNTKDKSKLLTIDPYWSIVRENSKWYIKIRYEVNIVMTTYYWGPPNDNMTDNETMLSDLARVDILLDMSSITPKVQTTSYSLKYNDSSLSGIKDMLFEEGALVDGPALGMSMVEAYRALGGEVKEDDYSESMELNGVKLFEFCSVIVDIYVESPKYKTQRGLKVGDSIEKVERLYGKPDVGFSGDDFVEYKFCCKDMNGELEINYYRGLTVYYENGLVKAFDLNQVILD